MDIFRKTIIPVVLTLVISNVAVAAEYVVKNKSDYHSRAQGLAPGDTLILADGVWNDFEIVFEGYGTAEQPITLKAQNKGSVFITGKSNLKLAGEYLVVSGLIFKDGYTPTDSVISFRKSKTQLANYSQVTEVVIDSFNNPERFEQDYWVAIYGKHNRFDHNHLEGKRNKGVTLAVRLDSEASRENYHRIDHNYFGPRPILGSNGGETLRIGTSHYSRSNSFTTVENNYFDRCDGELEIISNKSGSNVFRGNVFYQSRGTLTLRHGHDNLLENNVFFGNNADHTGGIRVINKRQTVRNNYLEGLAGYRFGGALVVMNGVPNSPINRYDRVEDSIIENNTLINSDHVQLAAGSDSERSAVPVRTQFNNNLFYHKDKKDTFTVYDDISGISFNNNLVHKVKDFQIKEGFESKNVKIKRAKNRLFYPTKKSFSDVGVARTLDPIAKNKTGVSWYAKTEASETFSTGKTIHVTPGAGEFERAVANAQAGDSIYLSPGNYLVNKFLTVDKPLTVIGDGKVTVEFARSTLFEIVNGGSLYLKGLSITGKSSPDYVGNSVIRTSRYSMLNNYQIKIEDCEVSDLDVNRFFNFLSVSKSTMADNIEIINSNFRNVSGSILKLDKESDDFGIYNAEYVTISGSSFENIQGSLVDFYRGGTDESTFGPHFSLTNSVLNRVGLGSRNKSQASIYLHGVQVSTLQNNRFINSSPIKVNHTVGDPKTHIVDNSFSNTPLPTVVEFHFSDKEHTALIENNTSNDG
ncbi:polysaccharide lyase 6 family protein [Sessilibacter corallicola]|uniref:Alginate lyase n=1 Tax=Sessilibacter corallicola TaxID=2904075 RepID=A0ABQ0A7N3_9GAMM